MYFSTSITGDNYATRSCSHHRRVRLAKRLTSHFRHKVEVIETDTGYLVKMAGADVVFTPHDDELYIEYTRNETTDSPERPYDETRLRFVITDHLDRMANQAFEHDWQD